MSPLFRYDTLRYVLTYRIVDNMPQNKKEAIDDGAVKTRPSPRVHALPYVRVRGR